MRMSFTAQLTMELELQRGADVDDVATAVQEVLQQKGRLKQIEGVSYVADVTCSLPDTEPVEDPDEEEEEDDGDGEGDNVDPFDDDDDE